MPLAGTFSPENMPDQVVVAAAAAEAAGQIGDANLEDRPGVVRQPARQAAIEHQVRPGAGALAEREDLPQILECRPCLRR